MWGDVGRYGEIWGARAERVEQQRHGAGQPPLEQRRRHGDARDGELHDHEALHTTRLAPRPARCVAWATARHVPRGAARHGRAQATAASSHAPRRAHLPSTPHPRPTRRVGHRCANGADIPPRSELHKQPDVDADSIGTRGRHYCGDVKVVCPLSCSGVRPDPDSRSGGVGDGDVKFAFPYIYLSVPYPHPVDG